MNKYILKYEAKQFMKNYAGIFFGMIFPILIGSLVIIGVTSNIPESAINEVKKSILLTINTIGPLSIFLIGFSSIFAKDLEEGVYDRLELFSIIHLQMAKYKFIVYYIFYMISNVLYFAIMVNAFDIDISFVSIAKHTGYVSLIVISLFFIAYALCLFTKKFSVAYYVSMILYFALMILGGMMGIAVEDLPSGLKNIAKLLPTSHFSSVDYIKEVGANGGLNYSFLQSIIVFIILSIILFELALYKNRRKTNQ